MKSWLMLSLAFVLASTQVLAAEAPKSTPAKDKVSYSLGVEMGRNFKRQRFDVDLNAFFKGVNDGVTAQKPQLSEKEMKEVLRAFQLQMRQQIKENRIKEAEENKNKEVAFLEENRKAKGVEVTPSGVQIKVLKAGNGPKPTDKDIVECYYRGTLLDGTEFDATEEGKPAHLKVAKLIPGWKEAVKMMPQGSKWQLVIPSKMAYAERGAGKDIGPNATLIFDVELVGITPDTTPAVTSKPPQSGQAPAARPAPKPAPRPTAPAGQKPAAPAR